MLRPLAANGTAANDGFTESGNESEAAAVEIVEEIRPTQCSRVWRFVDREAAGVLSHVEDASDGVEA